MTVPLPLSQIVHCETDLFQLKSAERRQICQSPAGCVFISLLGIPLYCQCRYVPHRLHMPLYAPVFSRKSRGSYGARVFYVFDDFHHEVIDEEATEYILQFILADLLRGLVCGVPSNTLRGLFIYR